MIKEAIIKLSKKQDLTYDEAEAVMNEIMDGAATPVQMASYLTALSMKGETIDEITASAAGMRAHCIKLLHDMDVLEIVGTGGDGANSFNISTTSSLVIAAGGVPVAKHGNRAASSKSGAADVLEALGVKITILPEKSAEILKKINICFLFAQNYHIAMKYVAPIRKELGIRTVFNILGPLSNPAGANMELMGVFDQSLVEPLAQVMMKLGVNRGMVVFGQDSLDEISMSAPTSVCEIKDGWFQSYEITPEQFGYTRCSKEELAGGTPEENAEITKAIVNGTEKGPKRQAVCMNAGAALYIAGKAESLEAGVKMAENLIDSGAAGSQTSGICGGDKQRMSEKNILEEIAEKTRERIRKEKLQLPLEQLKALAEKAPQQPSFLEALKKPGMSYICEVKKASPSKGLIAADFPYLKIAKEYEAAGASAISCLTEPFYFMGSDTYLREITETVDIPVLRKDFTVDKYMIYQAKAFGASAVLLICAILDDKELKEYRELAEDLGMDALVEAHDEEEVARALKAGAKIVGVNNRDLKTFKVDMNNSIRLRNLAPDNVVFVSESGIKNAGDIAILERNRVGAVLIGETLMRSPDKKAALEELNGGALR